MTDQSEGCDNRGHTAPSEGCAQKETVEPTDELPEWLRTIDSDPTHHHFVDVVQNPAPGLGNQITLLVAVCTCGWRSGEHQVYLGASTSWAEERAQNQLENASIAHIRSLTPRIP